MKLNFSIIITATLLFALAATAFANTDSHQRCTPDYALDFDGENDYVDCLNTFASISASTTKTIMGWAKSDTIDYSGQLSLNGRVVTLYRNPGNSCFAITAKGNPATWAFLYMRTSSSAA